MHDYDFFDKYSNKKVTIQGYFGERLIVKIELEFEKKIYYASQIVDFLDEEKLEFIKSLLIKSIYSKEYLKRNKTL